jgi:hypothetical protein
MSLEVDQVSYISVVSQCRELIELIDSSQVKVHSLIKVRIQGLRKRQVLIGRSQFKERNQLLPHLPDRRQTSLSSLAGRFVGWKSK